jgi:uncharacterized protein
MYTSNMTPEVAQHIEELKAICQTHGVRRLWVFGSAVSGRPGDFQPESSDVDLLVEFLDPDLGPWMRRYFDFKAACENLLRREVDVMLTTAPNARAIQSTIEQSKVPVYAAA